jgi:DNA polymerase
MYHPAAALHQPSLRKQVEDDFARLPEWLARAERAPAPESSPSPGPEQLSLF